VNPTVSVVRNISPYLIEGNDMVPAKRNAPFSAAPEIAFGSMPNDGGFLLLTPEENAELLQAEPSAEKFLRLILAPDEFINGKDRWCLWLINASPAELRAMPEIMRRIEGVKATRLASSRVTTWERHTAFSVASSFCPPMSTRLTAVWNAAPEVARAFGLRGPDPLGLCAGLGCERLWTLGARQLTSVRERCRAFIAPCPKEKSAVKPPLSKASRHSHADLCRDACQSIALRL